MHWWKQKVIRKKTVSRASCKTKEIKSNPKIWKWNANWCTLQTLDFWGGVLPEKRCRDHDVLHQDRRNNTQTWKLATRRSSNTQGYIKIALLTISTWRRTSSRAKEVWTSPTMTSSTPKEETLHAFLIFLLGGEAKEMVRKAAPSANWILESIKNFRWNRKIKLGAVRFAEMINKITPAKSPDEVHSTLTSLERLTLGTTIAPWRGNDQAITIVVTVRHEKCRKFIFTGACSFYFYSPGCDCGETLHGRIHTWHRDYNALLFGRTWNIGGCNCKCMNCGLAKPHGN